MNTSLNIHSSHTPEKQETSGRFWNGFLKILPFLQWVLTIAIAVGLYALTTRDTQTAQAFEINKITSEQQNLRRDFEARKNERDKQIEEIKKEMLTRDVFDAYHETDVKRMERIEKMLEDLLRAKGY